MTGFGHIKISRKAYRSDPYWLESREFSRWEAWEWLIQSAAWKPYKKASRRAGVLQIERGETPPLAERFLADAWGWSKGRVRRFLVEILEQGRIRTGQRTADGTTYHLANYTLYQGELTADRTAEQTGRGPLAGRSRGEIEEEKALTNDLSTDARDDDPIEEMKRDAVAFAKDIPPGPARKAFNAEVRGIISGDNAVAWTNHATGDRVPLEQRPVLLRLAFDALAAEKARNLHWALVHVVSQQLDPLKPRTAEEMEASRKRDAPRDGATTTAAPSVPSEQIAQLREQHPEVFAEVIAEFERYDWWQDANDQFRVGQLKQAIREKLAA